MVKRIGVLSNPRAGTSLMVRLLVGGFDLSGVLPLFTEAAGSCMYEYRMGAGDLWEVGGSHCYVISLIRDPRDIITSVHPGSPPGHFFIGFGSWLRNYEQCRGLESLVNLHEVYYEELVAQPRLEQEKMSLFLGLPVAHTFEHCADGDFYSGLSREDEMVVEMGGPRPMGVSQVGRWRGEQFSSRIADQLRRHPQMADILIELGYEKDKCWAEAYCV